MFNLTSEELKEKQALHTTTEIYQQPEVWRELTIDFIKYQNDFKKFIESIYTRHEKTRVIFTGAGTSAFIGDILVPELTKHAGKNVQFEAIATTDIVSNPKEYLIDVPTILVSFARSGNSPESVATVALSKRIIKDFYQVIITSNKNGELAKNCESDDKSLIILTPEKANDQSLAMTSSFSSMILLAYMLFANSEFSDSFSKQLITSATHLLDSFEELINEILDFDFNRVVYLGSGSLAQLAHEAALKMLELTAGKVIAIHESSLGFRHGPKSILNDQSIVVLFMSQDEYTRKYDFDILRELAATDSEMKIVALTEKEEKEVESLANWTIPVNVGSKSINSDFQLGLLYILFAQTLALTKSKDLGISPDNPSPDGAISRVVQGVTIYEYEE